MPRGYSAFDDDDVHNISQLLREGYRVIRIAAMYEVHHSIISNFIKRHDLWNKIASGLPVISIHHITNSRDDLKTVNFLKRPDGNHQVIMPASEYAKLNKKFKWDV